MMAGEANGNFHYFENIGTVDAPNFDTPQTNPFSLTDIGTFANIAFVDLDNDGDFDLMSGEISGSFKYFENTGTISAPVFGTVQTDPFSLSAVGSETSVEFADLDNDGDMDLMAGDFNGNFHYFQNVGTVSSPNFAAVQTNPFSLSQTGSRSTPSFYDIDDDGDLDLLSGSASGNFNYFENIGTTATPNFGTVQTNPFSLTDIGYRSNPTFADLDDDGDADLISGDHFGGFLYFEKKTPVPPVFDTSQFNPFSLSGLGTGNGPTLADLDNDGDLDLMSGGYYGNFEYFENTGSAAAPAFGTEQTNPFSLTDIGHWSAPTFVDLDNDGDFDLMSGSSNGVFEYYQNTGTVSAPAFGAVQTNPFSLTDIGIYSSPAFADLDNDGDLDLMSGDYYGDFYYFENTGTVSAPAFGPVQTNPFSLTDIGGHSNLTFADLDNDGDFDLMAGNFSADFKYFQNIGTASTPSFRSVVTNPFSLTNIGSRLQLSFTDLDNDGDPDLMAGGGSGNFFYFENITCIDPDVPTVTASATICPGTNTNLTITGNLNTATEWIIYTGSCAGTQVGSTTTSTFNVSPSASTTYYIRGEDGSGCIDEGAGSCGIVTVTVEDTTDPVADVASLTDVSDVCSVTSLTASNGYR